MMRVMIVVRVVRKIGDGIALDPIRNIKECQGNDFHSPKTAT